MLPVFTVCSSPVISESTRPIFATFSQLVRSLRGIDDCCEIELQSLKGRCHGNQFLFIQSTQFFRHSNQRVINFVHSATTRSMVISVIHEVDRRAISVHRRMDVDPLGMDNSPLRHFPDTCDEIRQEVQVLRWTHANQLTDQSTIINRRRGG